MKFSLQEIKEENRLKASMAVVLPSVSTAMTKYTPKIPPLRSGGSCRKHVTLHNHCAKLGIQRTRAKRWRNENEIFHDTPNFGTGRRLSNMEEEYQQARAAYHKEPCTCPTTK